MIKTTVYLPEKLKERLARVAAVSGRSEAHLIREAISVLTESAARPRPIGDLFRGDAEGLARDDEASLKGFGDR